MMNSSAPTRKRKRLAEDDETGDVQGALGPSQSTQPSKDKKKKSKKDKKKKKDKSRGKDKSASGGVASALVRGAHFGVAEEAAKAAGAAGASEGEAGEVGKEMKKKSKKDKKKKKKKKSKSKKKEKRSEAPVTAAHQAQLDEYAAWKEAQGEVSDDSEDEARRQKVARPAPAASTSKPAPKADTAAAAADTPAMRAELAGFKPAPGMSTRVFVGNLSFKIDEDTLREVFADCGEVLEVHWVLDKETGNFYGSSFVEFTTPEAAYLAVRKNQTVVMGRPMKVGPAKAAAKTHSTHVATQPLSEKPENCLTVFMGNLSFKVHERDIRRLFQHCGDISDVRWLEDEEGNFKGAAFVEFFDTTSADEAVKLNGTYLLGRPCRIDYAGESASHRAAADGNAHLEW